MISLAQVARSLCIIQQNNVTIKSMVNFSPSVLWLIYKRYSTISINNATHMFFHQIESDSFDKFKAHLQHINVSKPIKTHSTQVKTETAYYIYHRQAITIINHVKRKENILRNYKRENFIFVFKRD